MRRAKHKTLFIFEGSKTEPQIFELFMRHSLLMKEENVCVVYAGNILALYNQLIKYRKNDPDYSVVEILREIPPNTGRTSNHTILEGLEERDFSLIYYRLLYN